MLLQLSCVLGGLRELGLRVSATYNTLELGQTDQSAAFGWPSHNRNMVVLVHIKAQPSSKSLGTL